MNIYIDIFQIAFLATLLLLLAMIATFCLRNRSASIRHAIYSGTLLILVFLPVITTFLPPWYTGSTSDSTALELTVKKLFSKAPKEISAKPSGEKLSQIASRPFGDILCKDESDKGEVIARYGNLVVRNHSTGHYLLVITIFSFLFLWLLVVVLRLFGVCLSYLSLRKWVRGGTAIADLETQLLLDDAARKYRISRHVWLFTHPQTLVPFSIAVLKPVLFFPPDWKDWPAEKLQVVFQHELAHIARRDFFWQWVARIASVFYWFHPLFWYAQYRMRLDQELACDDAVLSLGAVPQKYADTLLEMAVELKNKRETQKIPNQAVQMASKNHISDRIRNILNLHGHHNPLTVKAAWLLIIVMGFTTVVGSMLTRRPNEAERLYVIAVNNRSRGGVDNNSAYHTTLHGKVLMPNGTAPEECYVSLRETIYYRDHRSQFYRQSNGGSSGGNSQTVNHDGIFSLETNVGANVVLTAATSERFSGGIIHKTKADPSENGIYVCRPFSLSPKNDNDDIVIQLEEATLLSGVLRYENGEPAGKQSVGVVYYVTPAFGADIPRVQKDSSLSWNTITNKNGEFEFPLWPGEFTIFAGGTQWSGPVTQKIVLERGKKTNHELVIPTPLQIKVEKEDGSTVNGFCVIHLPRYIPYWRKGTTKPLDVGIFTLYNSTDDERYSEEPNEFTDPIPINLCQQENVILVMSADQEYGIVQHIDVSMMGKELTLKLLPTVSGTAKLITSAGTPYRNQNVSLMVCHAEISPNSDYMVSDSTIGWGIVYKTDADGKVEFKLPRANGKYDRDIFCFKPGRPNGSGGILSRPGDWFGFRSTPPKFPGIAPRNSDEPFDLKTLEIQK